MEPLDYLRVLRRRYPIVAVAILLVVGIAVLTTPRHAPQEVAPDTTFTATHTLIRDSGATEQAISIELLTLFATTGVIPPRVVERLGEDVPPPVLAAQVQVANDPKLGTITVSSSGTDGERAALLANAFAEEILAYATEQSEAARQSAIEALTLRTEEQEARIRQLDGEARGLPPGSIDAQLVLAERDALISQYREGLGRLEQLRGTPPTAAGLYTLEAAVPVPVDPGGFQAPESARDRVLAAIVIGLALGLALAFGLERVDTKVRTRRGAEQAFGLPVVAEVPYRGWLANRRRGVAVVQQPASFAAEAYRMLRLALQIMPRWVLSATSPASPSDATGMREIARRTAEGPARVVLVTSATAGEGKTTTVANLAASFAEIGKSVLTLDCDFRHPDLGPLLGVGDGPGVSDYLLHRREHPSLALLAQESSLPGVSVVPSGTALDPAVPVGPDVDLITAARDLADVVILDAGPVLAVNDPGALVPNVDAVVIVARAGRTTAELAHRTTESLARLDAPLLGVTLVGVARAAIGPRYADSLPRMRPSGHRGKPDDEEVAEWTS